MTAKFTDPRQIPPGLIKFGPVNIPTRLSSLQRALLRAGALSVPKAFRSGRS